jgi:hypothetical protein
MLSLPNESKEEACQVAENSECPRSISLHIKSAENHLIYGWD